MPDSPIRCAILIGFHLPIGGTSIDHFGAALWKFITQYGNERGS